MQLDFNRKLILEDGSVMAYPLIGNYQNGYR